MSIYRETIQEFRLRRGKCRRYTIRVWREASEGKIVEMHDEDISTLIAALCKDEPQDIEGLAQTILDAERVNAVEVKDRAGNGVVLYRAEVIETNDGGLVVVT